MGRIERGLAYVDRKLLSGVTLHNVTSPVYLLSCKKRQSLLLAVYQQTINW